MFFGAASAAGVAQDVEQGFQDRLRSLPIPRSAVIAGRCLADTALGTWTLGVTTAVGFAVGFRLHAGLGSAVAAFGLCVLFSFAFAWLFITVGLTAGDAQTAQAMSILVIPLAFLSSAFVPVSTMPSWLQPLANNQPVTIMVDAVRCLAAGPDVSALLHHGSGHYVILSLLWTAALLGVFVPAAIARYSKR